MKNLMRMLVVALALTSAGFAHGMSLSGPGQLPDYPPHTTL
jgi:hypothetical protein